MHHLHGETDAILNWKI